MNTYELTLLFAEGNDTDRERVLKLINDFVKKHKGEVNKAESWGVKRTAYLINKRDNYVYEHFLLSLEGVDQVELNRVLKLDESVVRYLFVKV